MQAPLLVEEEAELAGAYQDAGFEQECRYAQKLSYRISIL